MKIIVSGVLVGLILGLASPSEAGFPMPRDDETTGANYIEKLDQETGVRMNKGELAEWQYGSNVTDENDEYRIQVAIQNAKEKKLAWQETIKFDWHDFLSYDLRRKFKKYSQLGTAALSDDKFEQLQGSISSMQTNYATSKICDYYNQSKCDLALDPEITEIFATSENPKELSFAWEQWHQEAGAKVRDSFSEYVKLSNEAAVLNNLTDYSEAWLSEYEQEDFEEVMDDIWEQIKPLYKQLHAYVRRKLWDKYGGDVLSRRGPIPAHLLGNMWAQTWGNVESFTRPYPNKPDVDITAALVEQNYTALKMFQTADDFFTSLNLTAMPSEFWENSIIVKPDDGRELVCHASAWDFYDGEDFRIKQCTVVTGSQFETVHHEMGHIEYYLQYKDQPTIYKEGANPGFHEAVGDVISLSVTSIKHLRKLGLIPEGVDDMESEINKLYSTGIDKIVFLPFAYLLDKFRYSVFQGETTNDNYNCHFWKLRESLQGLEPPVPRTEQHFDPAAKYHVSANVEYARYYVSFIIQFQFHRALCEKAGEFVPGDPDKKLTNCDIYQSIEAGNALGQMLQLGSSLPWQFAMEMVTGQRKMDAGALLEYFQPLQEWLEKENQKSGELIGWEPSKIPYCTEAQKAEMKSSKN